MFNNERRQEVMKKIRDTSRQEFILEEMIRLGFWDESNDPDLPTELIRRRGTLQRELNQLRIDLTRNNKVDYLIREARNQRMKEARARRLQNKERRIAERKAKAEEWKNQQAHDISYLGKDVSAGLSKQLSNQALLESNNLELINNVDELAKAMSVSVSKIRFMAFTREVSTASQYKRFVIPKKSGGVREISAPVPLLKSTQEWIMHNIIYKV